MSRRAMCHSDAIYYRDAGRWSAVRQISRFARMCVYRDFIRAMSPLPASTILDIGVSGVPSEEANVLEEEYPYPSNITCGVIGDEDHIAAAHPQVKIVKIEPGQPLPFRDRQFDIAYSNAVLEHVGGPDARRFFLRENLRVARRVFIAIPNRWFPIEHHTGIPLLHYCPALFRKMLRGSSYGFWTSPENLEFLGRSEIKNEWPARRLPQIKYSGLIVGPFSSNIVVAKS